MPFKNPIADGVRLMRTALQSIDYVAGSTGWQITRGGSAEFNNVTVRGTVDGSVITVTGAGAVVQAIDSNGLAVASIDATGIGSFKSLIVNSDDVVINGESLFDTIFPREGGRVLGWGHDDAGTITPSTTSEVGLFEVALTAPRDGYYQLNAGFNAYCSNGATTRIAVMVRDGGASAPTLLSPALIWSANFVHASGQVQTFLADCVTYLTAGLHRLLLSIVNSSGDGKTVIPYAAAGYRMTHLRVSDIYGTIPNGAVVNTGSGAPPASVQIYTKSYGATWSGTYNGSNAYISSFGNEMHQGYYSSQWGNQRSMCGFDYTTIQSDTSGADILGCYVTLYFYHWYYYSGGTALIGTHNYTSRPGTWGGSWGRVSRAGWPNPGLVQVDLGVTIGAEFQGGTSKGIVLGPGATTAYTYYGKASGVGMSYAPVLTIVYQK